MKIGIIGGTGKEGRGLAMRWARAGHEVVIGSRSAARAAERAAELSETCGAAIAGAGNLEAAASEVVVLSIPYSGHAATIRELREPLSKAIVVDIAVPLAPPKITSVTLPEGGSAALECAAILGEGARVVATLHHASSVHLGNLDHELSGHTLVCGNDPAAVETVLGLVNELGTRAVDAGPLANAVALESLTPVLLYMNKKYKRKGLGLLIAGLDDE